MKLLTMQSVFILGLVLLAPMAGQGAEFRQLRPMVATGNQKVSIPVAVKIPRADVEKAVRKVYDSWNDGSIDRVLAPEFYDKSRLLSAIASDVPQDAKIRVLAVREVQILEQKILPPAADGFRRAVTEVSVVVKSQLEFNDPISGFQRREGENELLLRLRHRLVEKPAGK